MSVVLADYEPWPIVETSEDYRREIMTANELAIAEFVDSIIDADAAVTDPDVAAARANTFIN